MAQQFTKAQFVAVLKEIGMGPGEMVQAVNAAPTLAAKQQALEAFKARVRKAFTRRLFEVHPDRNPDDPQAEELCKSLNVVRPVFMRALESMKLHARPQPPRQVIQRWIRVDSASTTTTVTSTSGGDGWYSPFVRVYRSG